jgi:hypothetical protein
MRGANLYQEGTMRVLRWIAALIGACAIGGGLPAHAADHLDSVDLAGTPEADINDLYVFTTPGDRLVLAMSVNRFANNPALGGNTEFDPQTLYQFKIDNSETLDGIADITIDIQFNQAGQKLPAGRYIRITGLPSLNNGDAAVLELDDNGMATSGDVSAFAGLREDPFFFDLKWFLDVATGHPLEGVVNGDGEDFYHNVWSGSDDLLNTMMNLMGMNATDTFGGANVSMIVLEFPTADVLGTNNTIGAWAATRQ